MGYTLGGVANVYPRVQQTSFWWCACVLCRPTAGEREKASVGIVIRPDRNSSLRAMPVISSEIYVGGGQRMSPSSLTAHTCGCERMPPNVYRSIERP